MACSWARHRHKHHIHLEPTVGVEGFITIQLAGVKPVETIFPPRTVLNDMLKSSSRNFCEVPVICCRNSRRTDCSSILLPIPGGSWGATKLKLMEINDKSFDGFVDENSSKAWQLHTTSSSFFHITNNELYPPIWTNFEQFQRQSSFCAAARCCLN